MEDLSWCLQFSLLAMTILLAKTETSVTDIECGFESDLDPWCGWTNINIARSRFPTTLASTNRSGPTTAQDGQYYAYLNTTTRSAEDQFNGTLTSDNVVKGANTGDLCLRFWYHMFGETMGNLSVLIEDSSIWERVGHQNAQWNCAAVDISTIQTGNSIQFYAGMGPDIYSIIAIDNIEVLNVPCIQSECSILGETMPTNSPSTTTQPTTQQTDIPSGQTSLQTTTEEDSGTGLDAYIPYIVGIPGAILVISIVIVVICLRRHKPKEPFFIQPNPPESDRYTTMPENPYELPRTDEEVYDDLNEVEMITDKVSADPYDDYLHPSSDNDNPTTSVQNGQAVTDHETNDDDYLNPRTSVLIPPDYDEDYITPTEEPSTETRRRAGAPNGRFSNSNIPPFQSDDDDYLIMRNSMVGPVNISSSNRGFREDNGIKNNEVRVIYSPKGV